MLACPVLSASALSATASIAEFPLSTTHHLSDRDLAIDLADLNVHQARHAVRDSTRDSHGCKKKCCLHLEWLFGKALEWWFENKDK